MKNYAQLATWLISPRFASFCSYAHEDESFRSELARHLSLLEDSGTIGEFEFWWDGLIGPPKARRSWARRSWVGYAATFSLAVVGLLGFLSVRSNRPQNNRPTDNPPAELPPAFKALEATFQSFDLAPEMLLQDPIGCIIPTNGRTLTAPQRSTGVEGVCYLNALEGDGPVQVQLSVVGPAGPVVTAGHQFAKGWDSGFERSLSMGPGRQGTMYGPSKHARSRAVESAGGPAHLQFPEETSPRARTGSFAI